MFRKRVIKKDKEGNIITGIVIKDKYADKVGFYMIKKTLPSLSNDKILKAKGIYDSSPETSYKPLIKELLIKEFEKRGLKWINLDKS